MGEVTWLSTLQLALRALQRNRVRTMLTTIGVIVGVASVIAMLGIATGSQQRVAEELEKLGTNNVTVRAGSATRSGVRTWIGTATRLTLADAAAVREIPGVTAVAPLLGRPQQIRYRGANWATEVAGVTPAYLRVSAWDLEAGEFLTDWHVERAANVCVLGYTVARELFGIRNPVGEVILLKQLACRVLGVLSKKGAANSGRDQDDVVLMPITTVQRKIVGKTFIGRILIQTDDQDTALSVHEAVRLLMRQRHRLQPNQDDDFRVGTSAELAQASQESARVFSGLLASIAFVSLVVGGIGIMNIMLVSVTERTREIGIRRAIGARQKDILAQFLLESIVLSGAGGVLGVALGVGAALAIATFSDLAVVIVPWSVGIAFLFSVMVGVVFGLYPAGKAARLHPAVALRYE